MGFLETVQENARLARRAAAGVPDNWYTQEGQYVLELITARGAPSVPTGNAYMVLPLGPEQYSVKRRMRQSITPTIGGVVAEERGVLWRELMITGSFGLLPKAALDSSLAPEAPVGADKLSGPGWTRRMIRNYFDVYGALKANPQFAADTTLVWHDLKAGDSWVVVPIEVDTQRNVARRAQYPWSLQLIAIADASAIKLPPAKSSLLDKIKSAIGEVNQALALTTAAIQEGSEFLGEVRYFAATIDSVIDKVTAINNSATDFVNGVADTLSVGADFISSTTELLESTLLLMETAESLPDTVRQNYAMALDGLDAMRAQVSAFNTTYAGAIAPTVAAERGAAGESRSALEAAQAAGPPGSAAVMEANRVRSTDIDLVAAGATGVPRLVGTYTGTRSVALASGDTLQSLAAQYLGDGSLWYDIAVINGLSPPYVSSARAPGTVSVGDIIAIPTTTPTDDAAIAKTNEGQPGIDRLGTDFALTEVQPAAGGRPMVDFVIDERDFHDFQLISGVPNLAQAIQMRLWTERGRMPLLPNYGLPRAIGLKGTEAQVAVLQVAMRQTIGQDPRISRIVALKSEVVDDAIEFDVEVVPIGYDTPQSIRTSVV